MTSTKKERIAIYNAVNKGYNISDIKKLTLEQIRGYENFGAKSLYELYQKPSNNKIESYNYILATYKPKEILCVQGSCNTYSVLLVAENDNILHITKGNNYLVKIKDVKEEK